MPVGSGISQDEFSRPIASSTRHISHIGSEVANGNRTYGFAPPNSHNLYADNNLFNAQHTLSPANPPGLLPSPELHTRLFMFDQHEARPTSAPETQSERFMPETYSLSQMLPPTRILPFPERKETYQNHNQMQTPSASEASQPAQPPSKAKAKKPRKSRAKAAKVKSPVSKASLQINTSNPTPAQAPKGKSHEAKSSATKKRTINAPPSSAPPAVDTTQTAKGAHTSELTEKTRGPSSPPTIPNSSPKRPTTKSSSKSPKRHQAQAASKDNPSNSEQQVQQPTPLLPNINPEEFLGSLDSWIRKYHNLPAPEPPQTAADHLAKYAKQNDEDRSKIINNMIMECLQDSNFEQLVEDVECEWKRIAIGF